jgi:hypothetical protein
MGASDEGGHLFISETGSKQRKKRIAGGRAAFIFEEI